MQPLTHEEAVKRLNEYEPKILICGVRKDGNRLESVLVISKQRYFEEVEGFSEYRTFFLKESDNFLP